MKSLSTSAVLPFILQFCLLLCAGLIPLQAQYEDTGSRGIYFSKKVYTPAPLPEFSTSRSLLPLPVVQGNPEYVELYWRAWELAFAHFKRPPAGSPFVSNYLDEGFSPSIFQWDTVFMTLYGRYAHHIFPAIQSLDNFYCRQYANGYICREIDEAHGTDFVFVDREHTVNPPLFSWAEVESYRVTGDKSRFAAILPVLEKYTDWVEQHRKKPGTVHGLYWNTGLGSGMDNSPRRGSGWVDMSVQMVLCYRDLAFMAGELGLVDKEKAFATRAADIAARVRRYMWNEADGIYYDIADDGGQVRVRTIAGFWPLLAEIPTPAEADRMLLTLRSPRHFWTTIPFASLSASEPDYKSDGSYWQGGVWAPTNVMAIKGLDHYARQGEHAQVFRDFSRLAAGTYLDGLCRVLRSTGTLWENYAPDAYAPGVPAQPDFVGWTGCGPIMLLIEDVLGFCPDGAARRLTWYLGRRDEHGIRGLRFGGAVVDAVCAERRDLNAPADIAVTTDTAIELVVRHPRQDFTYRLSPGTHHLHLAP
jgi:glycogen debranching enzyme